MPNLPVEPARQATWEELERVHTRAYLESIAGGTLPRYDTNRLGLPPCRELLDRCRYETGATIQAGHAALECGIACNLAGGTHHAFADRGLGFCVLNDVPVAVASLRESYPDLHILVVDTDAHQGNGTHALLRGDERSFTYSIHVGRNYPAIKEPGDWDVPLERYVSGADYLRALRDTLPPVLAQVEPDLVFWIAGADNHEDDRFGQMRMTREEMDARNRFVLEQVRKDGIPLVVLYGGGYNYDRVLTGALHADCVQAAWELG